MKKRVETLWENEVDFAWDDFRAGLIDEEERNRRIAEHRERIRVKRFEQKVAKLQAKIARD